MLAPDVLVVQGGDVGPRRTCCTRGWCWPLTYLLYKWSGVGPDVIVVQGGDVGHDVLVVRGGGVGPDVLVVHGGWCWPRRTCCTRGLVLAPTY